MNNTGKGHRCATNPGKAVQSPLCKMIWQRKPKFDPVLNNESLFQNENEKVLEMYISLKAHVFIHTLSNENQPSNQ